MNRDAWKRLIADAGRFTGEGNYPIPAYSEYMPAPQIGANPYLRGGTSFFAQDDPWGWPLTEYEEAFQLAPGLQSIANQIITALVRLARGKPSHGIARANLIDNPYWSGELAERAGKLGHERFVVFLPLALSRTQDDKGRIRWTLFGGSEQGPSRAFWKGFYKQPEKELPAEKAQDFFRGLMADVYGVNVANDADLYRAGFRIYPGDDAAALPKWAASYLWTARHSLAGVKYLLTFTAFSELPEAVRRAYLEGNLHLLPFPGSMLFWGAPAYRRLQEELPLAQQIPLLHGVARHEGPHGLRVPQSGWLHEPGPGHEEAPDLQGLLRNSYIRTHRWARVHRHEDEIAIFAREDKLVHVLFSAQPNDVELYGKPMARNVQIWTHDFRLLLDGPRASAEEIRRAIRAIGAGGLFGYRFQYPAMRVGLHEVYWQRPLAAYLQRHEDTPALLKNAPTGYLTAYPVADIDIGRPVELWPRILNRKEHMEAIRLFDRPEDGHPHKTALNVRKILDVAAASGLKHLPRGFARRLLNVGPHESLEDWLGSLPARANDPEKARALADGLLRLLDSAGEPSHANARHAAFEPLTFGSTANRTFETRYWNTIRGLAEGEFLNKCNADCVHDQATRERLRHHHRDLEALGDFLLAYYAKIATDGGLGGKALIGELPFHWGTDFDFNWSGGWLENQQGRTHERNLLFGIPGRDRSRAVIMADHYDTAYMEDVYYAARGGSGARIAAAGADDNHSATAALMLAARVFCRLSREGKLGCDVWLIHLTGEEFPSDCMGARHLSSLLVEGALRLHRSGGRVDDLSPVRVQGVYVLDMVAHNNDHAPDIFQIAPGVGPESLRLAYEAHLANESWNRLTHVWNRRVSRRGRGRGQRGADDRTIPAIAAHPVLNGEVRLNYDPRSTLYNTDGQVFSDAGIPAVLFMENYDINRTGYHDTHDTMANIDLDYGSALAAIAIESVARAACVTPVRG